MRTNKLVARFKNGIVVKGKTCDFSPNKTFFHLEQKSGEIIKIEMEDLKVVKINKKDLKAAFFVKDFEGNKDRKETYSDKIKGAGKKVKVQFIDGEVIIGYALSYSPDRHGFFLTPADLRCNNERIFIITSATKKITFL